MDMLCSIPPELRNRIFGDIVKEEKGLTLHKVVQDDALVLDGNAANGRIVPPRLRPYTWGNGLEHPNSAALMAVCRQLRNDVSALFYFNNPVSLRSGVHQDLHVLTRWLSKTVTDLQAAMPFIALTITITDCAWRDIDHILPLVDLVRTTRFDHRHANFDLKVGKYGERTRIARAILEAMDIGARARHEGWQMTRLQTEFQTWAGRVRSSYLAQRRNRQGGGRRSRR